MKPAAPKRTLTDSTSSDAFRHFRAALALKESSGNPSAIQWDTTARGLFQFIPHYHKDWITEEEINAYLPKNASPEEMERSRKAQMDDLFVKYYQKTLLPFVNSMRKKGIGNSYTDEELAAMAHFSGGVGAENFLRGKGDSTLGTVGNAEGGIKTYVEEFNKYQKGNATALFNSATQGAKHFGEYGLGAGVYSDFKHLDLPYYKGGSPQQRKALVAAIRKKAVPDFVGEVTAANTPDADNRKKKKSAKGFPKSQTPTATSSSSYKAASKDIADKSKWWDPNAEKKIGDLPFPMRVNETHQASRPNYEQVTVGAAELDRGKNHAENDKTLAGLRELNQNLAQAAHNIDLFNANLAALRREGSGF